MLDQIVKEVREKHFAAIPFALDRKAMESSAELFLKFLELPEKVEFQGESHPDDRGSHIGYVNRKKNVGDLDNKEYFHYNEYFEQNFNWQIPVLQEFVESAREVYQAATSTLNVILDELSSDFPEIHNEFIRPGQLPRFYLRYLKYEPEKEQGIIAEGHYDRGAITLALAESAPGLRIGEKDHPVEVEHEEGYALFMAGTTFKDVTHQQRLPNGDEQLFLEPAWHDVIQKESELYLPGIARWSIVFFADPIDMRYVSHDEAHQYQQVKK